MSKFSSSMKEIKEIFNGNVSNATPYDGVKSDIMLHCDIVLDEKSKNDLLYIETSNYKIELFSLLNVLQKRCKNIKLKKSETYPRMDDNFFIAYSNDNTQLPVDEKQRLKYTCENVRRRENDIYIKHTTYSDKSTKQIAHTIWKKFVPNAFYAKDAFEVALIPYNEDNPSLETFDKHGALIKSVWTDIGGFIHRNEDKPAVVKYKDDRVLSEFWYKHGKQHRVGGPALTSYWYNSDGNKKIGKQTWFRNGFVHRDGDEPALSIFENGDGEEHHWYRDGKHYRDGNKPSVVLLFENGSIFRQEWYDENNELIRREPAVDP